MTNMSIQPLWLTYFIEILLVLEFQLTKNYFGTFSYKAHFRPQISSNDLYFILLTLYFPIWANLSYLLGLTYLLESSSRADLWGCASCSYYINTFDFGWAIVSTEATYRCIEFFLHVRSYLFRFVSYCSLSFSWGLGWRRGWGRHTCFLEMLSLLTWSTFECFVSIVQQWGKSEINPFYVHLVG